QRFAPARTGWCHFKRPWCHFDGARDSDRGARSEHRQAGPGRRPRRCTPARAYAPTPARGCGLLGAGERVKAAAHKAAAAIIERPSAARGTDTPEAIERYLTALVAERVLGEQPDALAR